MNQDGILQTPSRSHGAVLERALIPSLPYSTQTELLEIEDQESGPRWWLHPDRGVSLPPGHGEPGKDRPAGMGHPAPESPLFLGGSIVLILAVVIWGSTWMVNRVREADLARATAYHKMEYTNKMAAIGRLGAGVAHEINNPVAIISEKAGLLKDLLPMSEAPPAEGEDARPGGLGPPVGGPLRRHHPPPAGLRQAHGGAARDDRSGPAAEGGAGLPGEGGSYRNIRIEFDFPEDPPTIVSDRGQLQQVFLNIINNAFAAVDDGGRIEIGIIEAESDSVAVRIPDNGVGIPEEHLTHIFDPFFTTKKGAGTGLGLSITYGIVQKLGGEYRSRARSARAPGSPSPCPRASP